MSRLIEKGTRKAVQCAYEIKIGNTIIEKFEPNPEIVKECSIYNKLADLEDIEEELGIDLITLFKAFKNGIWMKFGDQIVFHKAPDKTLGENIAYFRRLFEKEYVQNYGKTWALTKEELE